MNPKIFPSILMTLMVAAAIVYAFDGNWRQTIYWLAGAVITASVTF